jgi:hypothetical protein
MLLGGYRPGIRSLSMYGRRRTEACHDGNSGEKGNTRIRHFGRLLRTGLYIKTLDPPVWFSF